MALTLGTSTSSPFHVHDALKRQVANTFVLYLNYKKYHWQVYGPHFRDLHLLFDEHAKQLVALTDELAERLRMLGELPPSTPAALADLSTVSISKEGPQAVGAMIEEGLANHRRVIRETHQDIEAAESAGDHGTADLLTTDVLRLHEKQEWFLRELLKHGDGFSEG